MAAVKTDPRVFETNVTLERMVYQVVDLGVQQMELEHARRYEQAQVDDRIIEIDYVLESMWTAIDQMKELVGG